MCACFGGNNRHGKPHHENITLFQSEADCCMDDYEKPTGRSRWLLGLVALRELLVECENPPPRGWLQYVVKINPPAQARGERVRVFSCVIVRVLARTSDCATP